MFGILTGDRAVPPNITELSHQYHALPDDERARLNDLAKDAADAKKRGAERPLGMTVKETQRHEKRYRVAALADTMMKAAEAPAPEESAVAHYGGFQAGRRLTDSTMKKLQKQRQSGVVLHPASLCADEAEIRQAASLAIARVNASDNANLNKWHSDAGRRLVNDEVSTGMLLTPSKCTMVALPSSTPNWSKFSMDSDNNHMFDTAKSIFERSRQSGLRQILSNQFKQRCLPILDAEVDRIVEEQPKQRIQRPCLRYLHCVCDADGDNMSAC